MLTHEVYPVVGRRGELDNDCLCILYPTTRMDLQSPLTLRTITPNHLPNLIENLCLERVHSTDLATTSAFMIHVYIPDSTPDIILNLISGQLTDMQKVRAPTTAEHLNKIMTADPITYLTSSCVINDEPILSGTHIIFQHLHGVPHAYAVTLPTFSPATYILTLLANRR